MVRGIPEACSGVLERQHAQRPQVLSPQVSSVPSILRVCNMNCASCIVNA